MNKSTQKQPGPKRIRHGIKLRGKDTPTIEHPIAERWMQLLLATASSNTFDLGLEYARLGQVVTLEVEPGLITADVQGRRSQAYRISMRIDSLDEQTWERIVLAMADEAVYAAKLLAGEMPADIDSLFESLHHTLLPIGEDVLHSSCNCQHAGICKHGAAAGILLAERLSRDPMLIFTLRGMSSDRLLERLRQVRAMHTHGVAEAHADPTIPGATEQATPLESCVDAYWRTAHDLREVLNTPPAAHAPHAILRRLGPSTLKGRFPMVGLLASIYDTVAAHASQRRDESADHDANE